VKDDPDRETAIPGGDPGSEPEPDWAEEIRRLRKARGAALAERLRSGGDGQDGDDRDGEAGGS
jgi:hypothetical protein